MLLKILVAFKFNEEPTIVVQDLCQLFAMLAFVGSTKKSTSDHQSLGQVEKETAISMQH